MTQTAPEPPAHLELPEQQLWRDLVKTGNLSAADLALLRSSLESHQRARRCREAIERTGEAGVDRFGQIKPHPLLGSERENRAAFVRGLMALGIE